MFNHLRAKLVALAQLAASFVRPGEIKPRAPRMEQLPDPGMRLLPEYARKPGAFGNNKAVCHNSAGSKLARYFNGRAHHMRGY